MLEINRIIASKMTELEKTASSRGGRIESSDATNYYNLVQDLEAELEIQDGEDTSQLRSLLADFKSKIRSAEQNTTKMEDTSEYDELEQTLESIKGMPDSATKNTDMLSTIDKLLECCPTSERAELLKLKAEIEDKASTKDNTDKEQSEKTEANYQNIKLDAW